MFRCQRLVDLIVVHVETGTYCALSRFCTHAGRTLAYIRTRKVLQCTNFNHSRFELNGDVRKGPAEVPLASHPVRHRDGMVFVWVPAGAPRFSHVQRAHGSVRPSRKSSNS
jgi:Rieske Fe-S protein